MADSIPAGKSRPSADAAPSEWRRPLQLTAAGGGVLALVAAGLVGLIFLVHRDPVTGPANADEPAPVVASMPAVAPVTAVTFGPHSPAPAPPVPPAEPAPIEPEPAPVEPESAPAAPAPKPVVADPPPKPRVKPEAPPADESKAQRVSFLGTVAEGQRFFFIADNSGSMNGVKMTMLKNELALTLKSLKPESQFYVTFFNSNLVPMPAKGWQQGERDVPKALQWVASMGVNGDTNPQPAFDLALKVQPRPDVIFFMTDGQIPANVPARVRKLNAQDPKVVIHTILLDARNPQAMRAGLMGADTLLKQIAADSGGLYREFVIPLVGNVAVRPMPMVRPPVRKRVP
jgi:hypothetical protein